MHKVLFIINHKSDNQYSMLKYASMHKSIIDNNYNKKFLFKTIFVKNIFLKNSKNKIVIRINKYILFPIYLFFISKDYRVIHICDQGNSYLVNFLNCKKIIVTCHDLILLKFRLNNIKDRILAIITKKSLEKANIIIALSINTKNDIKKYLKTEAEIYQIYSPVIFKPYRDMRIKYKNFILHIGNHFYKNRSLAINFFKYLSKKSKKKYCLVCVGEVKPNEKKLFNDIEIKNKIFFLNNISEPYMASLYKKCRFLLVTSLYEGYGYPILEAYYFKKKIISTSSGSLKEIVLKNFLSSKNTVNSLYKVYKSNLNFKKTYLGSKLLKNINNKKKYKNLYNKIYSL